MAALRRLERAWVPVGDRLLAEEGSSLAQYAVLYALSDGPRSGADLARDCGVTGPTMSNVLAGLHRQGLIERTPGPNGGRVVLAVLTKSGRELMRRCYRRIDAIEQEFLTEASASELDSALTVLSRWAKRFEELKEPQTISERLK